MSTFNSENHDDDARNRLFYTIDNNNGVTQQNEDCPASLHREKLSNYIANSILGKDKCFNGPFGARKVLYLDYTATGRCLRFIEDYIRENVLPEYGNTHTTTSVTALQTTLYRHEARDIVRNAVNASEHDGVIFCGTGTTAAIHKLIHALNLSMKPIIFVGPFEHHSNLLPWRRIGAKVVQVNETDDGQVDVGHLEAQLKDRRASGRPLIGCFSVASNITGIITDTDGVTALLHRYGALALWDYATAAPYVKVDMNPVVVGPDQPFVYKDAVYFSGHKFIGGVSSPGILVAKKKLFSNHTPDVCGGGTVFFVRGERERYLKEVELKEEGGTPDIVGSIRAGLAMQLKVAIGDDWLMQREQTLARRATLAWSAEPDLVLLGNARVPRLPVFSFVVYHAHSGYLLHHNYVTALLNDLFGIQARGGCACAGPYAQRLLGIDESLAAIYEDILAEDDRLDRVHLRRRAEFSDREILRPGFTRISLPYFLSEDEVTFTLEALTLVAQEGWKLLPKYMFNPESGEWRATHHQVFRDRKWLGHISYATGAMQYRHPPPLKSAPPTDYEAVLMEARREFANAEKSVFNLPDHSLMFDDKTQALRWFLLPSEAQTCLQHKCSGCNNSNVLPFCPDALKTRLSVNGGSGFAANQDYLKFFATTSSAQEVVPCQEDCGQNDGLMGDKCHTELLENLESGNENRNIIEFSEIGIGKGHLLKDEINSDFLGHLMDEGEYPLCQGHAGGDIQKRHNSDITGDKRSCYSSERMCRCFMKETFKEISANVKDVKKSSACDSQGTQHAARVKGQSFDPLVNGGFENREHAEDGDCSEKLDREPAEDGDHSEKLDQKPAEDGDHREKLDREPTEDGNHSEKLDRKPAEDGDHSEKLDREPADDGDHSEKLDQKPAEDGDHREKLDRELTEDGNHSEKLDRKPAEDGDHSEKLDREPADDGDHSEKLDGEPTEDGNHSEKLDREPAEDCNHGEKLEDEALHSKTKEEDGKSKWICPGKKIFKPFLEAVEEYSMLRNGDRVLVCLSGGKDSLSLLHTLKQYQFYSSARGVHFELAAVTVDPETPSYDPSTLIPYLASLAVPYFYEKQGILDTAANLPYECASICSFCSRMKRGRIYACARRELYNVLALGQHLDDLAESFFMSLFHNGVLRTMKACYTVSEGDLRVIRPFIHVREKDLRQFAEKNKLPVIAENCPACFEAPKERQRIKQLLASQEIMFPRLYSSLRSAMSPIVGIGRTGVDVRGLIRDVLGDGDEVLSS